MALPQKINVRIKTISEAINELIFNGTDFKDLMWICSKYTWIKLKKQLNAKQSYIGKRRFYLMGIPCYYIDGIANKDIYIIDKGNVICEGAYKMYSNISQITTI